MAGPREPAAVMGLETAQNTSNILRLLEASHGSPYMAKDAISTVWHENALCWKYHDEKWQAHSPGETSELSKSATKQAPISPRLRSLNFSDNRTALVKLVASDGTTRYLSLLRLEEGTNRNDGWTIVREVQVDQAIKAKNNSMASLQQTLQQYLKIEHGGGVVDYTDATRLFAPRSSLLAVGMAAPDEEVSAWSAPAGSLLEIPLDTYLDGVKSQTPHADEAAAQDEICVVDVNGNAASAIVRVGNGGRTLVFEDHLLLGQSQGGVWKILSKTFSPQSWPQQ